MKRINPQLTQRMEEIVRAELGMPKEIKQELPDANLELVDMEASKKPKDKGNSNQKQVSSGGSGCSSTNLNTPNTNSPRRPSSADRKRKSPGNDSQRSKSITTGKNNTEDEEQKVLEILIIIFLTYNSLKIDVEDTKDPGLELEKFAHSITASSSCTSSLSCNASEDGLQPVQSPIDVHGNNDLGLLQYFYFQQVHQRVLRPNHTIPLTNHNLINSALNSSSTTS